MDPPECSGHSHDHGDHENDLGLSLRPEINFDGVTCFNERVVDSGKSILKLYEERLSPTPFVQSEEDDAELLFYIPFTEAVTIKSISIRSVSSENEDNCAPPRRIKLFTDRDDLDFETVQDLPPQMELELLPPHHFADGTIDYPVRPAGRFQNISSISVFVQDNYSNNDDDDDDVVSTIITFMGFKGKGTKMKRKAVETVYESRGMPADHKTPGAEFGSHQLL